MNKQTRNAKTTSGHVEAADAVLSGYARLRPQPGRWRQLLASLASPAIRLHRWRDARGQLWAQRPGDEDCRQLIAVMRRAASRAGCDALPGECQE